MWQIIGSAGYVSKTVLPTPVDIVTFFQTAHRIWSNSELIFTISILRAAIGFAVGAGLGLLIWCNCRFLKENGALYGSIYSNA